MKIGGWHRNRITCTKSHFYYSDERKAYHLSLCGMHFLYDIGPQNLTRPKDACKLCMKKLDIFRTETFSAIIQNVGKNYILNLKPHKLKRKPFFFGLTNGPWPKKKGKGK